MKIAIFVAGEQSGASDDEFPRYCAWFRNYGVLPCTAHQHEVNAGDNFFVIPPVENQEFNYLFAELESDYAVVAIQKNDFLSSFTHILKTSSYAFQRADVENILKNILCGDILSKVRERPLEVVLFGHWHSAQPSVTERSFNDCIKDIDINKLFSGEIVSVKSIAVSTRRKKQFDLGHIELPKSSEELMSLIRSFDRLAAAYDEASIAVDVKSIKAQSHGDKKLLLIVEPQDENVDNLSSVLSIIAKTIVSTKISQDEDLQNCYPLFFGTREHIEELGFNPPDEFVIEKTGYQKPSKKTIDWESLAKDVEQRLQIWESKNEFASGVSTNMLSVWCRGAFRCFCMQDKDVHGYSNGTINPEAAKNNPEQFWKTNGVALCNRIKGNDAFAWQIPLWRALFTRNMDAFEDAVNKSVEDKGQSFYKIFNENVLKPTVPTGAEIAFAAPTRKINLLVIDDDVDEKNPLSNIHDSDDKALIQEVFSVTVLKARIKDPEKDFASAVDNIRNKIKNSSFDAILLDLHLGKEEDPTGYQLIRILKIFLPTIPIIIYSQYDDMGHIERAFRMGATWYIKKDEVYKLPRHFISLLSLKEWQKEWKSIKSLGLFADGAGDFNIERCDSDDPDKIEKHEAFRKKFDATTDQGARRRYLTYKVLEQYPGRRIFLRPMGGGFSPAATFRVIKKDAKSDDVLQSPLIVKIDREFYTRTEFERYFRFIRPYIANETGRVENPAVTIDADNSAIVYTYAGKSGASNELLTFRDMFSKDILNLASCRYEGYAKILDDLFTNILPRIHKVPVTSDLVLQHSSYPNHFLGEVDSQGSGFVGNYRVRMPLARHYIVTEFCHSTDSGVDIIPFEYKDKTSESAIEALECSDKGNGAYSKMTVILEGAIVKHAVRFRSDLLIPGKMLYVKVTNPDSTIVQEDLSEWLDKSLADNPDYSDVFSTANATSDVGNRQSLSPKQYFTKLFKTFAGIKRNSKLDDFGSIVEVLYEIAMTIIDKNPEQFSCREGIVHGDLNFANIMLDRQSGNIGRFDVWLIDFARTRRDVIAHDFNVFFTATLAQLFRNELWHDARQIDPYAFAKKLLLVFRKFAVDVIFGDVSAVGGLADVPPDYVANDKRLRMVYQILRRVRKAAIEAKVSTVEALQEDVYAMTTALCCLYTFRIFLRHEKNVQGAAALLAVVYLCLEKLDSNTVMAMI